MIQLSLLNLCLMSTTTYNTGVYGEKIALQLLRDNGYVVTKGSRHVGYDLVAIDHLTGESMRVEVKTARCNIRGEWAFTFRKHDRYGYANHLHSDVMLLLAMLKTGLFVPFVIPVEDVHDIRAVTICSHPQDYAGKYARYRQNPHTLTLEMNND